MAALHNRIWQQDQEQQESVGAISGASFNTLASQAGTVNGSADMAAVPSTSAPAPEQQHIADMPTVSMTPSQEDEYIPIPPPPPVSQPNTASSPSEAAQATSSSLPPSSQEHEATGMTDEAADTGNRDAINQTPIQEKDDTMQQTPSNQPEQSAQGPVVAPLAGAMPSTNAMPSPGTMPPPGVMQSTGTQQPSGGFSSLPVGTIMHGRYEITQGISENPQEHVYQVIDRQGYQHCWNCGSEQNAEGDEFCIDCGASLLNVPYIMHEYGPAGAPSTDAQADANVLQGNIVNTFVDQGRTYMIEQPQVPRNAFPNGVHLVAAGDSDAGDVRRSEPNEDSILILQLQRVHESLSVPTGVFIVADGLGGHDNGQVASRTTINIIAERMVRELLGTPLASEKSGGQANLPDEDGLVAMFHGAIEDANTTLVQMNQRDKTDMGSTITGFMIAGDHAYIINVGDSRTYMMRGKQLYQLTTDHSLVGQLVAGGLIEPDEVYTHPQRSQIFRSLGDKPNVQIDVFKQQLHPGDILLSCSDGLWEMVRNPQIESILNEVPDPQMASAQLIEAANKNGGEDNVSAVIVYIR